MNVNMYDVVKLALMNFPATRNSDRELYLRVLKELNLVDYDERGLLGHRVHIKDWDGMPPFESVTRARRKVQEMHAELRGSTYQARQEKSKEYPQEVFKNTVEIEDIRCDFCGARVDNPVWRYIFRNGSRIKLPFCNENCARFAQMSAEG